MNKLWIIIVWCIVILIPLHATKAADTIVIHFFGRETCVHCISQKEFLDTYVTSHEHVTYQYYDVMKDTAARAEYDHIVAVYDLPKVTPLTIIGDTIIQGFDTPEITGKSIIDAVERARTSGAVLPEFSNTPSSTTQLSFTSGCDESDYCVATTAPSHALVNIPFFKAISTQSVSLISLSVLLGIIDGFNPCALWVLITFLILLSQIGDKKKMILVAGMFLVAEALMYNLILNIWFTTWDFIGLDEIVSRLVGVLAVSAGVYFLYRFNKQRHTHALVCDVTDLETQSATTQKIQKIIHMPITIMSVLGIVMLAFSVNVIEFACSVGIPQTYTKILEMNSVSFLAQQGYMLIYTLSYMLDDIIVFTLAIWGFSKLETRGHMYAQISLFVGGILMILFGFVLLIDRSLLVL
jgi:cytochrome c biogenesis protein CcdA/glutaredoxin